jgi:hypothetical protein
MAPGEATQFPFSPETTMLGQLRAPDANGREMSPFSGGGEGLKALHCWWMKSLDVEKLK